MLRAVAISLGAVMVGWAAIVQVGAWWLAVAFLAVAGGAVYELSRREPRPASSAKIALVLTVVLACIGAGGLLDVFPAVTAWAAPAAFFVAWLEYLASFPQRRRGNPERN